MCQLAIRYVSSNEEPIFTMSTNPTTTKTFTRVAEMPALRAGLYCGLVLVGLDTNKEPMEVRPS